jgi:hypothetical protein
MKIRRTIVASASSVAIAAALLLGSAAPASAVPPIVIPPCESMFASQPSYWSNFASINGDTAVRDNPTPVLYGSDFPVLKALLRATKATTCTWRLEHGKPTQNFTISIAHVGSATDRILRRWYASRGIIGVDREATLGGVVYQVSAHELDVLMHGRVWIAITERNTSVEGFTMQAATSTIASLNPWILVGTE